MNRTASREEKEKRGTRRSQAEKQSARQLYSSERSKWSHIPKMLTYEQINEEKKKFVLSAIIPCKVKEICTRTAFDSNAQIRNKIIDFNSLSSI